MKLAVGFNPRKDDKKILVASATIEWTMTKNQLSLTRHKSFIRLPWVKTNG